MTLQDTKEQWSSALSELRTEEKDLMRAMDELAAKRRRLPRLAVTKDYKFRTPRGEASLADLFDRRGQLIVYHHMLKPSDNSPCPGCSMVADQIVHLAHLHARDTSFTMVSRAPIAEIEDFRQRMGWDLPWAESLDDFNPDHDVTTGFGVNVFLREGDEVWRTYFTTGRGVEILGPVWSLLDITPFGRQEDWQDAPEGVPQSKPYQWWRLHDLYEKVPA